MKIIITEAYSLKISSRRETKGISFDKRRGDYKVVRPDNTTYSRYPTLEEAIKGKEISDKEWAGILSKMRDREMGRLGEEENSFVDNIKEQDIVPLEWKKTKTPSLAPRQRAKMV